MRIESERPEKDATRLGFELATVSAVVTVIAAAIYAGELSIKITQWYRKSNADKIILQTPFKSIEVRAAKELTESEVKRALESLLALH
jgi:hypothetical protein